MRNHTLTTRMAAAFLGSLALAAGALGGEPVRVICGFERDEVAKTLPEFGYWGEPTGSKGAAPGFRGKQVGPEYKGDITAFRKASSRDYPLITLTARNVTQGDHAYGYVLSDGESKTWAERIKSQSGITACPPKHDYHDIEDWYYQRCDFGYLWRQERFDRDWSGYDRLRFDVFSTKSECVLGVKVRDMVATRQKAGPHGIRTPVGLFKIPAGKQVTCDYPLAEVAKACELDLARIHRYHIRLNSMLGGTEIYLDNVRLVTREAAGKDARLPLVAMEGEVQPWGRPVVYEGPTKRDEARLKREGGKVEKLGPVLVTDAGGQYACAPGHFGGPGHTYFQSARRSCVAYDNKRLLVVIGGGPGDATLKSRSVGEGGGVWAFASFDGGATWGGVAPGEKPSRFGNWYWRGNLYSDRNGDVYWVGTQNCDSYHEGFDVMFRRLAFTGEGWTADRGSCVDQNGYKCPAHSSALRTDRGRLWAAWSDGFGGVYAKRSDDDGLTWAPCKDASAAPPRQFHEPKLEDLAKPADARPKPPAAVILWPGDQVCGGLLVPYQGEVAAFASDGSRWQAHDGAKWSAAQKGPFSGRGLISLSVLGTGQVFVSQSEGGKLRVARLEGEAWQNEELDSGEIGSNILTASGGSVFCFYVKKSGEGYEVLYRRWKDGKWEPAARAAAEPTALNMVAAPMFSPPDYAAVFWDQRRPSEKASSFVKFMRIPNE